MPFFKPGGTAFATVVTSLTLIQSTLDTIPFDPGVITPLKKSIGGLLLVLNTVQRVSDNMEDILDLAGYLAETQKYLSSIKEPVNPSLKERSETLASGIQQVVDSLQKMRMRSYFQTFIRAKGDTEKVASLTQRINRLLHNFLLSGSIAIEVNLIAAREDIQVLISDNQAARGVFRGIQADTTAIKTFVTQDRSGLPHVATARFESSDLPRCLKGTRVKLLEEINTWMHVDINTDSRRIYWLCGQAGTGKTTISLTIAELCGKENRLGASFFFSRDHADRNNLGLVFPSIAHQLGIFHPPLKKRVAAVLENNPDLSGAAPMYQLESLIINPLQEEGDAFPSVVVVMDALDECSDDSPVSKILTILSGAIERLPQLKFFLTSRPEVNIREGFRDPVLTSFTTKCVLHEIEHSVVDQDIETYLRAGFSRIARRYSFPNSGWPTDDVICKLVQESFRLFIFAATVLRFVGDEADDPEEQLNFLLDQASHAESTVHLVFQTLDNLYFQVLRNALPPTRNPVTFVLLKAIVGAIVLLCEPLPVKDLATLLNIPSKVIRTSLRRLHSVMTVPKDDGSLITLCHPSFRDYITQRCRDPHYAIDELFHHGQIALLCFEQMKSLKRDICMIGDPSKLNSEVEDLHTKVEERVGPTLRYACLHWIVHFSKAASSFVVWRAFMEFFTNRFLYWLEVLSLLGSLQKVPGYLQSLKKTIERSSSNSAELQDLLHDCDRFVAEFFEPIHASCLHVYFSALAFTPTKTLLYATFKHELGGLGGIVNPVSTTWDNHIQLMTTNGGTNAAYSPDGTQVVSGCDDATVSVWDVESGLTVRKMQHDQWATCVTFSPDGSYIASGSIDLSVRIWSCETGLLLKKLTGHDLQIWTVCFSSKNQLLSGSDDRTIRMWDITDGTSAVLTGHTKTVRSVRFAPDDSLFASASDDTRIGIWDPNNKNPRARWLTGHTDEVYSVVFLTGRHGGQLASSSADMTIRIWDLEKGSVIRVFKGHVDRVWTVSFSAHGWIASGSDDRTVRLWDLNSSEGEASKILLGHTHWVNRVCYSPDGNYVVSAAQDSTIRIWNGDATRDTRTIRTKPALAHYCSGLSQTATLVATAYSDSKVHVRNLRTGKVIRTFKLPAAPFSLTFSYDEKHLLCGVGGRDLGIWEIATGKNRWSHPTEDFFKSARYREDGKAVIGDTWFAGNCVIDIPDYLHAPPSGSSVSAVSNPGWSNPSLHYQFEEGWVFVVQGNQRRRVVWLPAKYRHPDALYCRGKNLWLGEGLCTLDLTGWFDNRQGLAAAPRREDKTN